MIEGNFKINQELNKIVLNSERVFTNQYISSLLIKDYLLRKIIY